MKEWIRNHEVIVGIGTALVIFSWFIGKKCGEKGLIELLIHNFEYNFTDNPVVTSSDKNLGNLMYELKAECIGD